MSTESNPFNIWFDDDKQEDLEIIQQFYANQRKPTLVIDGVSSQAISQARCQDATPAASSSSTSSSQVRSQTIDSAEHSIEVTHSVAEAKAEKNLDSNFAPQIPLQATSLQQIVTLAPAAAESSDDRGDAAPLHFKGNGQRYHQQHPHLHKTESQPQVHQRKPISRQHNYLLQPLEPQLQAHLQAQNNKTIEVVSSSSSQVKASQPQNQLSTVTTDCIECYKKEADRKIVLYRFCRPKAACEALNATYSSAERDLREVADREPNKQIIFRRLYWRWAKNDQYAIPPSKYLSIAELRRIAEGLNDNSKVASSTSNNNQVGKLTQHAVSKDAILAGTQSSSLATNISLNHTPSSCIVATSDITPPSTFVTSSCTNTTQESNGRELSTTSTGPVLPAASNYNASENSGLQHTFTTATDLVLSSPTPRLNQLITLTSINSNDIFSSTCNKRGLIPDIDCDDDKTLKPKLTKLTHDDLKAPATEKKNSIHSRDDTVGELVRKALDEKLLEEQRKTKDETRPVICYDAAGNVLCKYESLKRAYKDTFKNSQQASIQDLIDFCHNRKQPDKDTQWKFADDPWPLPEPIVLCGDASKRRHVSNKAYITDPNHAELQKLYENVRVRRFFVVKVGPNKGKFMPFDGVPVAVLPPKGKDRQVVHIVYPDDWDSEDMYPEDLAACRDCYERNLCLEEAPTLCIGKRKDGRYEDEPSDCDEDNSNGDTVDSTSDKHESSAQLKKSDRTGGTRNEKIKDLYSQTKRNRAVTCVVSSGKFRVFQTADDAAAIVSISNDEGIQKQLGSRIIKSCDGGNPLLGFQWRWTSNDEIKVASSDQTVSEEELIKILQAYRAAALTGKSRKRPAVEQPVSTNGVSSKRRSDRLSITHMDGWGRSEEVSEVEEDEEREKNPVGKKQHLNTNSTLITPDISKSHLKSESKADIFYSSIKANAASRTALNNLTVEGDFSIKELLKIVCTLDSIGCCRENGKLMSYKEVRLTRRKELKSQIKVLQEELYWLEDDLKEVDVCAKKLMMREEEVRDNEDD